MIFNIARNQFLPTILFLQFLFSLKNIISLKQIAIF